MRFNITLTATIIIAGVLISSFAFFQTPVAEATPPATSPTTSELHAR